jgi:hypothetical protein
MRALPTSLDFKCNETLIQITQETNIRWYIMLYDDPLVENDVSAQPSIAIKLKYNMY